VLWSVSAAGVPVDPAREHELRPLTRWLRELGRSHSATRFTRALAALQAGTRRAVTATAHCDAVLVPTLAQPPAPLGWFTDAGDPAAEFDRMIAWTPFTAVYNATGQPAVSLPLHESPDGLPIGVMLVGRPADEATLLRLSGQLEQARPWRDRHPDRW
jgi:amidase